MGPTSDLGTILRELLWTFLLVAWPTSFVVLITLDRLGRAPDRFRPIAALSAFAFILPALLASVILSTGSGISLTWGVAALALTASTCFFTRSLPRGIVTAVLTTGLTYVVITQIYEARSRRLTFPTPERLLSCLSPRAILPPLPPAGIEGPVQLRWSPGSRFLVSGDVPFVLWSANEARALGWLNADFHRSIGSSSLTCILASGFTADAEHFFAWDAAGVHIWSTADQRPVATRPLLRPDQLDRIKDPYPMALGTGPGDLAYRDFTKPRLVRILSLARDAQARGVEVPLEITNLTFSFDGRLVACGVADEGFGLAIVAGQGASARTIRIPERCERLEPSQGSKVLIGSFCGEHLVDLDSGEVSPVDNVTSPLCPRSSPDLRFRLVFDKVSRRTTIVDRLTGTPVAPGI